MHARIKGVHVNVPHFKEHKNIKSLKADARNIFGHLSQVEQDEANEELLALISTLPKKDKATDSN